MTLARLPWLLIHCFLLLTLWHEQRSCPGGGMRETPKRWRHGWRCILHLWNPQHWQNLQYLMWRPLQPRWNGVEEGRGRDIGGGREVTRVITYLTVGPDGCRSWAIYIRQGGAGQRKALTDHRRQGSPEGIPEGWKSEKPWRYQLGTVALHKICQFQKSTDPLICKLPFLHLVHEITLEVGHYDMCFQVHAILTWQEAAKAYLVGLLKDTNLCAIHVECITIMP